MKKLMALGLAVCAMVPVYAQVGVSIGINQPGVYGQINIGGGYPPPAVVYPQPVLIAPGPVAGPPMYLYVPPLYQRNWRRYCGRYHACGRPVYFVQEQWVRDRYHHEHPEWRGDRHDRRDWHGGPDHDRHGDKGGRDHGNHGDRGDHGHN
ncbi:MAG: hypothetical protein EPN79_04750 [Burkholderiaceae bacterium]|nr:MAG: hypothetical protein EPN79_04750 [Burkholderiaceae bacterium]TBR75683.1 MAG: hypothetical protein EPN64_11605 [Burkholderiaceae bacterium]